MGPATGPFLTLLARSRRATLRYRGRARDELLEALQVTLDPSRDHANGIVLQVQHCFRPAVGQEDTTGEWRRANGR